MLCANPSAASLRGAHKLTVRCKPKKRRSNPSCLLYIALVFCCTATAANAAAKSEITEHVTAIKPDGTITLSSSGAAVFGNILYPDPALAERWIAEHLLQHDITFKTRDEDRYGRTQISSDSITAMLRDGAAICYGSEGAIADAWKNAEASARVAKRGVWANKDLVLTPENASAHLGEFHVVEGVITRIYEAKAATYLNFGDDWHSDFSITIPAKIRRSMKPQLAALRAGSRLEVRGAIHEENGPMITLTRPDNLELH